MTRPTDLRKCLAEEFTSIYIFHLRGNARTSGEQRRKEKDNVFGMGSRAPIAISLFVKNPAAKEQGQIYFNDIGDYLSQEAKLKKIEAYASVAGISKANAWAMVIPDQHGDWLNQRDDSFERFILIGSKDNKDEPCIFRNYSNGLKTQRDPWCYNASKSALSGNVKRLVTFYNNEMSRFAKMFSHFEKKSRETKVWSTAFTGLS